MCATWVATFYAATPWFLIKWSKANLSNVSLFPVKKSRVVHYLTHYLAKFIHVFLGKVESYSLLTFRFRISRWNDKYLDANTVISINYFFDLILWFCMTPFKLNYKLALLWISVASMAISGNNVIFLEWNKLQSAKKPTWTQVQGFWTKSIWIRLFRFVSIPFVALLLNPEVDKLYWPYSIQVLFKIYILILNLQFSKK